MMKTFFSDVISFLLSEKPVSRTMCSWSSILTISASASLGNWVQIFRGQMQWAEESILSKNKKYHLQIQFQFLQSAW